ncbi:hypothetical protein DR864_01085 [Runella rosea]|uniref:Oligosaccharide repeat unit polymerase n=1 Tax=Runella rosea TaxID=2259595 RepID=A0A344TCP8_9BACT|nr:O-antigen polymerase [Runella rosea]AXE16419.1 hypothetical protein DR864_01085 [Runella rosea]
MNSRVELFLGAIDANIVNLFISFLVFLQFLYSWYYKCYKQGFKIDYWHFYIFYNYIFVIFFMYPFAASYLNGIAMGGRMDMIKEKVDDAFLITLTGYISIILANYLFSLNVFSTFNRTIIKINNWGGQLLFETMSNKKYIYLCISFLLFFTVLGLVYSFSRFGFSFKIRNDYLAIPEIRPIFNFWTSFYNVFIPILIIIYIQKKAKMTLLVVILLSIFATFTGNRSTVFFTALNGIIFYLIHLRHKLKLRKLSLWAFGLANSVFLLGLLRDGGREYEIENLGFFTYSFLYGNNFSDLRDFAYILSFWDENLLYGKSYLAAFISFIPRYISDFRNTYAISAYTNNFLGYEDGTHGGIRGGPFFESYLNFGIIGVVVIGFLWGSALSIVSKQIKTELVKSTPNFMKSYSYSFLFISANAIILTANFWQYYVFIGFIILGSFLKKI